ncbi:MAG TPA: hypothetical protein VFE63_01455 [Roseiarcus sp.]|jgi:hypothetical protein|nr:hypothetical protein [Roseiarcus sp.]
MAGTLIRIAVTPRAYRAIKGVLPAGSIVLNPERDERGRCLLTLDEGAANSLSLKRRLGESMSDVIIRLAQKRAL